MENGKKLRREDLEKILRKNTANILAKLAKGKTITAAEREILESQTEDPDSDAPEDEGEDLPQKKKKDGPMARNVTDLARKIGVTNRTIQRWKKRDDCPDTLSINDWLDYKDTYGGPKTRSIRSAVGTWGERRAAAQAMREELQVEKLKLEIAQINNRLMDRRAVFAEGARVGNVVRSVFARLERDLAARLEGLTPEQRRAEVRVALAEAIDDINTALLDIEGDACQNQNTAQT